MLEFSTYLSIIVKWPPRAPVAVVVVVVVVAVVVVVVWGPAAELVQIHEFGPPKSSP